MLDFSIAPPTVSSRIENVEGKNRHVVTLQGDWSLRGGLPHVRKTIEKQLDVLKSNTKNLVWDLNNIKSLDSVGAITLWQYWGGHLPANINLNDREKIIFERLTKYKEPSFSQSHVDFLGWVVDLGNSAITLWQHTLSIIRLIGQLFLSIIFLIHHPSKIPWKEWSAGMYHSGFQALGVSALVGLMIGLALSYLISLQLQIFGASTFIVPILGIGVLREMGPLIAAILIAGRSGSSMTAQIGVMRITQEIDVLEVMGISPVIRLVFPKVAALFIVTPLVVVWTSAAGIVGGILASQHVLGIGVYEFLNMLPKEMMYTNLWVALIKGASFGMVIAIIACHFGLQIQPNTSSLGRGTTSSVVTSITVVMLMDAGYAILLRNIAI